MSTGDDDLDADIAAVVEESRKLGQADGVTAIRNLRARLELADPPTVNVQSAELQAAFRHGFGLAIQAARAEAATVLANLIRGAHNG